jgi:hypothetical protein
MAAGPDVWLPARAHVLSALCVTLQVHAGNVTSRPNGP